MEHLHEDLILMVFEYLDNQSIFNLMRACKRFANVFSTSPKLQRKFKLFINQHNRNHLCELDDLIPVVPFRNVKISVFKIDHQTLELFGKYKKFIEILNLQNIGFDNLEEFQEILCNLPNLVTLKLKRCVINYKGNASLALIPSLKCLRFDQYCPNTLRIFIQQKSVEKVSVSKGNWDTNWFSHPNFNALTAELPNLNHIVLEGPDTATYFDGTNFPYKIRKLEAYLITHLCASRTIRLNFFKSQQSYLKELTIHKLPYDYDGGEILKFLIEEMKLEKFYYGDIPLILDGRKQMVKKFTAWEVNINCTFEMFRQFPSIQSLTLFLTHTDIDIQAISQNVDRTTNLFRNLRNLDVLDHSDEKRLFALFLGLYKNCRNISRLSFRTEDENINYVLRECLPSLTNLNEIYLRSKAPNSKERLENIKEFTPNIKKLSVYGQFADEVKEIFGNEVEIVEI